MTSKETLSDKRYKIFDGDEFETQDYCYHEKYVRHHLKNAIKRISFLMNNSDYTEDDIINIIKQEMGDKLT